MQLLLVSVCLAFLGSASAENPEPRYVVTFPSFMTYPSTQKVCVIFLNVKGLINMKLEMSPEDSDQVDLLGEYNIENPEYPNCYSFQVPKIEKIQKECFVKVSAEGENFKISERKKVLVVKAALNTFIQTDKSLYKPGDTVNFRVVSLDSHFRYVTEKVPVVDLWNPNRERIGQWSDVSPTKGISDFTFYLSDEAPAGEYKINVGYDYKKFSVSEYELKTYEVIINLPDRVAPTDDSFTINICASYTYRKPVQGSLTIGVCEFNYPFEDDDDGATQSEDCQYIRNVQTDSKGCVTKEIDIHFFNLTINTYIKKLKVAAFIKEHSTGLVEKAKADLSVGMKLQLYFLDFQNYYHKGLPFTGRLAAMESKNQPRPNETIFLRVNNDDVQTSISLVTDEKGIAHFTLDTSKWKDFVSLTGSFHLRDMEFNGHFFNRKYPYRWLKPFYSDSNSYVQVKTIEEELKCGSQRSVKVEYTINKNELHPVSDHLSFFYLVLSRGRIYSFREHKLQINKTLSGPNVKGSFSLQYDVDLHLKTYILVFTVLRSGTMTGDRTANKILACFDKKVKLQFSKKEVQPREKVDLDIEAEAGSLCSVRSVNKGLLLLRSHGSDLDPTTDKDDQMSFFEEAHHALDMNLIDDIPSSPCSGMQQRYAWEMMVPSMHSLFMMSYMNILTNTKVHKPKPCSLPDVTLRSSGGKHHSDKQSTDMDTKTHVPKKPFTRKLFPDTWLYDLVSVGSEGHKTIQLTTPDSITDWVTDAFCLSESGYGEASAVTITTFKPYFVDVRLPRFVIQGALFPLTAVVYNYLKSCILVTVSLHESTDFKAFQTKKDHFQCLCMDESATFTWNVTATKIGNIKLKVSSGAEKLEGTCKSHDPTKKDIEDSVEKSIRVTPSGKMQEHVQAFRLCPADESLKKEISIQVPENIVKDTEHGDIVISGDILNHAAVNAEDIMDLPTACGEQTVANFATSLHLIEYLRHIKQLTPELEKKLVEHLTKFYQKILPFRNEKGSYSLFRNDVEDVWLTAFVVRSLSHARKVIYVDEKSIQHSVKWLSSHQLPSGCFEKLGYYFNNQLQDTEYQNMTVTAYITVALIEHGLGYNWRPSPDVGMEFEGREDDQLCFGKIKLQDSLVDNALRCLRNGVEKVNHTFTEALMAYAFSLSGDHELKKHMLDNLEKTAKQDDISKHWEQKYALSASIETTGYILMALLSDQPTPEDIEEASKIMNWIVNHQDPRGGFYSTQVTVTGIQALSKFAEATFVESGDVSVTVQSLSGFRKQYHVKKNSKPFKAKETLPDVPGDYVVTATGKGCVYARTFLSYYTPVVKNTTHFDVSVTTRPAVCTYQAQTSFDIVLELSYSGNRTSTNMVLIEMNILPGFTVKKSSITALMNCTHVKKTEIIDDLLVIYLDEVTHKKQSYVFTLKKHTHVDNLMPANLFAYDYYEQSDLVTVEYNSPCQKGTDP
ncbi:alpha-2-macroglobulin-like protein 1 [Pelodytes ibericus]